MYGKQILQALQENVNIKWTHYEWVNAPEETTTIKAYGILTENKIEKIVFDENIKEEILDCDVDVFCYVDEADELKAQVESVFDLCKIAYEFDDIGFEQEEKLVHLLWTTRCIYGDGISPTSTLYLHDLFVHSTSGYSAVQVEEENLIANNVRKDISILGVIGTFEGTGGESYVGPYEVVSSTQNDQTLETIDKSMLRNVTIAKNVTGVSPTPETTGTTFTVY